MTRTFESAARTERTVGDLGSDPFGGQPAQLSGYLTPSGQPDFAALQNSEEFHRLRQRLRRFVFPMSIIFIAWYMTFVLLAAYAHDFMSEKVIGEVNIGMIFGLLQFVSTVLITMWYVRYARKRLDPAVDEVRDLAGAPKQ
jgi:uncharacterized membrane protein (DUF485 family)